MGALAWEGPADESQLPRGLGSVPEWALTLSSALGNPGTDTSRPPGPGSAHPAALR